jgi:hypothetical protein
VKGEDQGMAQTNLPQPCYPLFDVYGPVVQVPISIQIHIHQDSVCRPS